MQKSLNEVRKSAANTIGWDNFLIDFLSHFSVLNLPTFTGNF